MNKLLGYILFVLTFAYALHLTGYYDFMLDLYSLLLIFGLVFGVMFLSYGTQAFSAFKYISQPVKSQREFFFAVSFFDHLANTALIAGLLGTLLNQVMMLANVETVETLLPATGFSLISFVYGYLVAKFIFAPLKQNVIRNAKISNINGLIQLHIDQNNSLPNGFLFIGFLMVISNLLIFLTVM